MKVKELKEFLKQCNNEMEISVEFTGAYKMELEWGFCFKVNDCYLTDKNIYLEFK